MALLALALVAVPQLILDPIWQKKCGAWAARPKQKPRPLCYRTIGYKWLGLIAVYAMLFLCYWAFPIYEGDFYAPIWTVAPFLIPLLICLSPAYIALVERKGLADTQDVYWNLGRMLTLKPVMWERHPLKHFILGWAVKGFFLPLMFCSLNSFMATASNRLPFALPSDAASFLQWYFFLYAFFLAIDVVYAVAGYLCTFRLADTHIRTAEPSAFGWIVCMCCYAPFWDITGSNYLTYDADGLAWDNWLAASPVLQIAWGSAILVLHALYAWSNLSFGLRFSNLTWRGLISHGPYRFTKHPSYLFKNISWWLIAVPFIHQADPAEAVRNCLMLGCINIIYYMRARTEETHLMRYPEYQDYCAWMAQHSGFAKLMRPMQRVWTRWHSRVTLSA